MRDHREGQDPARVDITARLREIVNHGNAVRVTRPRWNLGHQVRTTTKTKAKIRRKQQTASRKRNR